MLIKKIFDFFKKVFGWSWKDDKKDEVNSEKSNVDNAEDITKTMITRLYVLNQKIVVFQESFPEEYKKFQEQINKLTNKYEYSLKNYQKDLTYEINPENDGELLGKVLMLEDEIENFIQKEVKFEIISKQLQKLILKLNILYNVTITHNKKEEKEKAMAQVQRAIVLEFKIVQEFKNCKYLLEDNRLNNEIIKLISYVDYEIFKNSIRNSSIEPIEALKKLAIMVEFNKFDYVYNFKAFFEEELAQINLLILQIPEHEQRKLLKEEYNKILNNITEFNEDNRILLPKFWTNFFDLESNIFELLVDYNVEKENIKIKISSGINIEVKEDEVITSPKANTYLSLLKVFSKIQDDKIILVMKLLKNLSNDITYKEIYFLLVLFEIDNIIQDFPSEFEDIEKYQKKYPYSEKIIFKKKKKVLHSNCNEYIFVFTLEECEEELLEVLKQINMDFKVVKNNIFFNKIYFNGLTNVSSSLETINKKN